MEDQNSLQIRMELTGLQESVNNIKNELRKIIIGQDAVIDLLIAAVIADGHVLIEGVPGVAKTLIAKFWLKLSLAVFREFNLLRILCLQI